MVLAGVAVGLGVGVGEGPGCMHMGQGAVELVTVVAVGYWLLGKNVYVV